MKYFLLSLSVLLAVLPADRTSAQDGSSRSVAEFILTRCPELMVSGQDVSEELETSSGLNQSLEYSTDAEVCTAFLQSDVSSTLDALHEALTRDGWMLEIDDTWSSGDDFVVINRFDEDGASGGLIARARTDSPFGLGVTTDMRQARRPLAEAAAKAVFDLCPIALSEYEPDDEGLRERAIIEERAMMTGRRAADPAEGKISLMLTAPICLVVLTGPKAEAAAMAVLASAGSRGYDQDSEGYQIGENFVFSAAPLDAMLASDAQTEAGVQIIVASKESFDTVRATTPGD